MEGMEEAGKAGKAGEERAAAVMVVAKEAEATAAGATGAGLSPLVSCVVFLVGTGNLVAVFGAGWSVGRSLFVKPGGRRNFAPQLRSYRFYALTNMQLQTIRPNTVRRDHKQREGRGGWGGGSQRPKPWPIVLKNSWMNCCCSANHVPPPTETASTASIPKMVSTPAPRIATSVPAVAAKSARTVRPKKVRPAPILSCDGLHLLSQPSYRKANWVAKRRGSQGIVSDVAQWPSHVCCAD